MQEYNKFKIGDRVLLSPNSKWVGNANNPLNTPGEIIDCRGDGEDRRYDVSWDDGSWNGFYRDECLLPAYPATVVLFRNSGIDSTTLSEEDKQIVKNYLEKVND